MSKRVLIVDDDPEATKNLDRLLTAKGFSVKQVNDSTLALTTALEFQPDFALIDFIMPTMHGGDVAWQLASDAGLEKTPLLVMISGLPMVDFAIKLPPVQICALQKPVKIDGLLEILRGAEAA